MFQMDKYKIFGTSVVAMHLQCVAGKTWLSVLLAFYYWGTIAPVRL